MMYYNENDKWCIKTLKYHIEAGNLHTGVVDQQSIMEVSTDDIRKHKQIHLFAGIGGFPLGFKQAGVPDEFSVITGGFPCQDVSVAGPRNGLAGQRSGLWFEFLRVIQGIKPTWVIIENVSGLLSSNGGRDMGTILGGLAKCGYWWSYRVLDSQFFGVPQRRRRVFIVASLRTGCPQKVLFESQSSPGDPKPSRQTKSETSSPLTQSPYTDNEAQHGKLISYDLRNSTATGDVTQTLQSKDSLNAQPVIAFGGNNTTGPIDIATAINAHGSRRYDFESETFVCNTFNGYTGGPDDNDAQGNHLIAFDYCIKGSERTQIWRSPGYAQLQQRPDAIAYEQGVRRLTPIECERLQGFPDGWTEGNSDTQRYRQLGNAVTVPVIKWLGERLLKVGD
ncbi:MAG: DNA (cytosine-5-)-methyltransferase [Candidatus Altiarchaeales archaeon]|nr:DNA (cytosine-5-)-methyltransferase [Candidatus Altiarchaeales archaeon]